MAINTKIPPSNAKARNSSTRREPSRRRPRFSAGLVRIAAAGFILLATICFGLFAFLWVRYEKIIDRRMNGPIFSNSAQIYARPQTVRLGETISIREIVSQLRRAGYTQLGREYQSPVGGYRLTNDAIEIHPGPESYHSQDVATIQVLDGKVARITAQGSSGDIAAYELEPQLVTALFSSRERAKRQVVHFNQIPKVMVNAVLAIEDRRFFQHGGVNYFRLFEAAWADLRTGGKAQGASTITMQMARAFFLSPEKTIKRKVLEMLIAIELEQKFTKEQIFELYANQVDMGQRGSFAIMGFAEAAHSYFNKDLQSITLPEAALLAGIIQRPSYLSPYRHPERALDRRNLVLDAMVETGAISRAQAEQAKATPLKLAPPNVEASDAPYFVDLVKDQLAARYHERELNEHGYHIYTTLDPDLQRAAAEAVQDGMRHVDALVQNMRTRRHKVGQGRYAVTQTTVLPGPMPQVALVALDPHTGEVLALVGGRDYGYSQLDHAVAKRPTGSIFKPFVYAAAINTALDGNPQTADTPVTMLDDSPSVFTFGDQTYEPHNYKNEYHGLVPARYALAMSLNNATVKLAEQVGYDKVAALARAAGISSVKPTPAMALGAYDASPLEMAGAYTVFANQGVHITPIILRSLRTSQGDALQNYQTDSKTVLDPRVASVMTSMMQGVLDYGTAYGVRQMGFTVPAAGKTGTSHDAWFAGYTSNLLCIVWVGYDDYSDLRLSGAQTAAPIWGEFMKKATQVPGYRDVQPFPEPPGVVDVQIDKVTNRLATPACPQSITLEFIDGTQPTQTCEQSTDQRNFFQKLFGIGPSAPVLPPPPQPAGQRPSPGNLSTRNRAGQVTAGQPQQPEKKKGFFNKIIGVFKSDDGPQKSK